MSYYKDIGYLTQEPSVFDGTILENLTYWTKEKPTKEKIKEIIKKAKCEFIYDFKAWVNTEIWERWVRLSWWQKQRLAIAKIFLKNPKIIFLDEPTSALDSKSEKLIHESFSELFKWRTVIIIAHRLQTVKSADEIFVLEKWKVVETWTHESLIKKKWHYKEMLDLQSGF
jgi:ABC-type multidrug transport system fused ATPase/permease subunit